MTSMKTKEVKVATCEHCGYEWAVRAERPRQCPNCKRQINYEDGKINQTVPTVRDRR